MVGVVEYLKELMPKEMHATSQSIIWGAYIGIGQMSGNLAIGGMLDRIG
ncbi:MAG: hypothetical protein HC896_14205, partial [Bacteroidales bacterium]|nr:hypothetical protein [Bacteroidales bacterium]